MVKRAVLSQKIADKERVISCASRTLPKAENRFCITRRELFFFMNFLHYLYGCHFLIRQTTGHLDGCYDSRIRKVKWRVAGRDKYVWFWNWTLPRSEAWEADAHIEYHVPSVVSNLKKIMKFCVHKSRFERELWAYFEIGTEKN